MRKPFYISSNCPKHYYAGTQRVSSKIGTTENLGDYLYDWFTQGTGGPVDVIGSSFGVLENAEQGVVQVYDEFEIDPPTYESTPVFIPVQSFVHGTNENEVYWFHPDHLGSTSYITNLLGEVSQHMEYFAFGETFVEEHRSSNNSPYKFNGKELDEETGWYYYGARYYDPRISVWLSVDPLAEETMTPYQYTYQNPIRFIDPDGKSPLDIIFLNKNGSINKVIKDGKAHITIIDEGKRMSLSSYNIDRGLIYWNNRNRKVVANISAYYGKKIGISGIGATYRKSGIAHYNPSDKGIWISPQDDGRTHSLLNNKSNLQNVLVHEDLHKIDHINDVKTTFTSHANVYINQMADDSFKDTTIDFQEGIVGNFLNYVHSARLEKGTAHGKKLIDEFNDTNQGGWKAGYGHRSGYGWPVEHNGETIYFDTKKLKDAN